MLLFGIILMNLQRAFLICGWEETLTSVPVPIMVHNSFA